MSLWTDTVEYVYQRTLATFPLRDGTTVEIDHIPDPKPEYPDRDWRVTVGDLFGSASWYFETLEAALMFANDIKDATNHTQAGQIIKQYGALREARV
jgi:hypothetical protein